MVFDAAGPQPGARQAAPGRAVSGYCWAGGWKTSILLSGPKRGVANYTSDVRGSLDIGFKHTPISTLHGNITNIVRRVSGQSFVRV